MRKSRTLFTMFGIVALGCCGAAQAATTTILYDSGGFELPRFSTVSTFPADPTVIGNLRGQDSGVRTWNQAGAAGGSAAGTAVVQSLITQSGLQAVQVTRTSNDQRWAPSFAASPIVPGNGIIAVDWDMRVTQTLTDPAKFGPFFGIESYGAGVQRIGGFGVDATTGEVLFEDPVNGLSTTVNDTKVAFGTFNHFKIDYNYATHTYSVAVNGVVVASGINFVTPGVNTFTDADIASLAAAPPAFANQTGTSYFDNYVVSLVTPGVVPLPAPAIFCLLAVGTLSIRKIVKDRRVESTPFGAVA